MNYLYVCFKILYFIYIYMCYYVKTFNCCMFMDIMPVGDPGGGGAGGARPPFQKNNKKLGPIFVQFCS